MNEEQNSTAQQQETNPEHITAQRVQNTDAECIDFCRKPAIFEARTAKNMNRNNSSIAPMLYAQIEQQCNTFAANLTAALQPHNVQQDIIDAVLTDYAGTLQDDYEGLYLNYDGITALLQSCPEDVLTRLTETDEVFEGLLHEYTAIKDIIDAIAKQEFIDVTELPDNVLLQTLEEYTEELHVSYAKSVGLNEILRYYGKPQPTAHQTAIIYRHVYCLTHLRRLFITTNEDLLHIVPCHCNAETERTLKGYNTQILRTADLYMKRTEERVQDKMRPKGKRGRPKKETALTIQTEPNPEPEQKPVIAGMFSNAFSTLCGDIVTSSNVDAAGRGVNVQPLMQMIKNEYDNGNTGVSLTYAKQVLRFIFMLPSIAKPVEETEDKYCYRFELGTAVNIGAGNGNPDTKTLQEYAKGFRFFDEHFLTITEARCVAKRINGVLKPVGKWKKYRRTFHPVTMETLETDDGISKKTEVTLYVDKAIATGRRQTHLTDGKAHEIIKQPKRILFTAEQAQKFTSPAEIAFFALMCNARHRIELKTWDGREEDILAEVFDYNTRLRMSTATELLNTERRKVREELKTLEAQCVTREQQLQDEGLTIEQRLTDTELNALHREKAAKEALLEDTRALLIERIYKPLLTNAQFVRTLDALLLKHQEKANRRQSTDGTAPTLQEIKNYITDDPAKWDEYKPAVLKALTDFTRSRTRESIRTNKPKDRQKLQTMFDTAKDCGLITAYTRTPAANGIDYLWEWERPKGNGEPEDIDAEEVK